MTGKKSRSLMARFCRSVQLCTHAYGSVVACLTHIRAVHLSRSYCHASTGYQHQTRRGHLTSETPAILVERNPRPRPPPIARRKHSLSISCGCDYYTRVRDDGPRLSGECESQKPCMMCAEDTGVERLFSAVCRQRRRELRGGGGGEACGVHVGLVMKSNRYYISGIKHFH